MLRTIARTCSTMSTNFRIALIQLAVTNDKPNNVRRAVDLISEASKQGASVISLPECFNSPYGVKYFPQYAEKIPEGETCQILSKAAKENEVYLVGGSIPEVDDEKLYNTCTIWNPSGELIAKHRKIHLFDINVPGGIKFQESAVLSAGNTLTTFTNGKCKFGVGICYDLRFEELARLYRNQGCDMLLYPGAFNMTTGPLHWELLQRGRAVDNQVYVATIAPAQDKTADYKSWGHSQVIDPWGKVIASAEFDEKIVYADIDLNVVKEIRQQIPVFHQRRTDIYNTVECKIHS